jgi:phage terminase large subunit-like protein
LKDVLALNEEFNVEVNVVDDREANAMMGALADNKLPVISFRKNATNYSEPTKDIIARVAGQEKGIVHDGNPVLAWNAENVIGGWSTSEMVLPKKVSEHSNMKIDGFDAMVMSHACMMEHVDLSKVTKPNPMAERGVRVL